jgi:hypothetical protein
MATKSEQKEAAPAVGEGTVAPPPAGPRVRWNTANLKSGYANVVTATSTREEVVLNFGINQSWERTANEMEIELTHRIILSPMASQRLLETLSQLMRDYQARYGSLSPTAIVEAPPTAQ